MGPIPSRGGPEPFDTLRTGVSKGAVAISTLVNGHRVFARVQPVSGATPSIRSGLTRDAVTAPLHP